MNFQAVGFQVSDCVTMLDAAQNSHSTGLNVYDRVDGWAVNIRAGISTARVVYTNPDADCNIAVRMHISKVTVK